MVALFLTVACCLSLTACLAREEGDPARVVRQRLAQRVANFDLRDVPLDVALDAIADEAGVPVVANPPHPDVQVDLLMRQVPLELALDAVAAQADLRADVTAGGVVLRERKSRLN